MHSIIPACVQVICVTYVSHTCHILVNTCYIRVAYVLHTRHIRVIYVSHMCHIRATYTCHIVPQPSCK